MEGPAAAMGRPLRDKPGGRQCRHAPMSGRRPGPGEQRRGTSEHRVAGAAVDARPASARAERGASSRVVLTSLAENVVTLDGEGRITYINHAGPGLDVGEVPRLPVGRLARARARGLRRRRRCGPTAETGGAAGDRVPRRPDPDGQADLVPGAHGAAPRVVAGTASRWWPPTSPRRRRTERDLRDAVLRMEQAERTARVGHWRHDVRTGVLEPSAELLRIVGAPPGRGPPADAEVVRPPRRPRGAPPRVLRAGARRARRTPDHAWRAVRPDGDPPSVGSAEPVFDGAGNVVAVFGVTQDVTARAEALRASERARSSTAPCSTTCWRASPTAACSTMRTVAATTSSTSP